MEYLLALFEGYQSSKDLVLKANVRRKNNPNLQIDLYLINQISSGNVIPVVRVQSRRGLTSFLDSIHSNIS